MIKIIDSVAWALHVFYVPQRNP